MLYKISFCFLLLFSYSILGWVCEVISCSYLQKRLVLNRGFLIGPYCPIYGCSALLMILFLTRYVNEPITLFVMATVICTIIEYITSYLMEKLFKARWWDYSEKKFDINGRVCLENACMFGLLGLLLIYTLNPFYTRILSKIPDVILIILAIIIFILFTVDIVLSLFVMFKLKINTKLISEKDATEEIKQHVYKYLIKNRLFTARLLKAFPKAQSLISSDSLKEIKEIIDIKLKKKKR